MTASRSPAGSVAVLFLATVLCGLASAKSPAPAAAPAPYSFDSTPPASGSTTAFPPAPDCMTSLFNMSDCLGYVQAGSKSSKPDKACCPELAGLVDSAPQCLCTLLNGNTASQSGFQIDMKRALQLPSVCGVSTPDPSLCPANGVPAGAPTMPGVLPPNSVSPSAGNNEKSGLERVRGSVLAITSGLAIAFIATIF